MTKRAVVILTTILATSLGPLLLPSHSGAQIPTADAKCRKGLGKGVSLLAKVAVAEQLRCHKARMLGQVPSVVDCGDLGQLPAPGSLKLQKAEYKLGSLADKKCTLGGAAAPAALGFVSCLSPCDALPVDDYHDVAACLVCLTETGASEAVGLAYGSPPTPGQTTDDVTCQTEIGKALSKYVARKVKEQQRCQFKQDKGKISEIVDCETADLVGALARELQRVNDRIAECDAVALGNLDSCGSDVPAEQACLQAGGDLHADALYRAVYDPVPAGPTPTPTPSPTPTPTPSPTPTPTPSPTPTPTPSPTPTPTPTPSPTPTPTPTPSPSPTPTPTPSPPPPPTPTPSPTPFAATFCSVPGTPIAIPDDDPAGVSDELVVASSGAIVDLNTALEISHAWVGDLTFTLTHADTGTSVTLIDQPGVPASGFGCSGDDIDATVDDEAALPIESECAGATPTIAGALQPNSALSAFDGENIAGTWTLAAADVAFGSSGTLDEWCLIVNDPPTAPAVEMTAYRPQAETYGAPLLRRPVADDEEESPGAGLRINGDDDDGNLSPDRDDLSVAGENDLIEVELTVNQVPAAPGVEYVLRRTNGSIKVWADSTKNTPILNANDEAVLSFASLTEAVWVENPNGGSAFLDLEARTAPGGSVLSTDRVKFFTFTSIVIGLHGEFQFPTDPPWGPNEGVSVLAVAFHEEAYDSHMYVENEVESDGSGAVYDEIVDAVQSRGVTSVALYGFSHGGGSICDLADRLETNKASIGTFDLLFTAYIDGIENDSDIDLDPETCLPSGTGHHVNYYQQFGIVPPWGGFVPGADVNVNVTSTAWGFPLFHITITNHINVQNGVHDPLVSLVPR